jgi:hypothetical protein
MLHGSHEGEVVVLLLFLVFSFEHFKNYETKEEEENGKMCTQR